MTSEIPRRTTNSQGFVIWRLQNDIVHRDDGPAVECPNGQLEWYQNGKLHREDAPAIEWPGGEAWYQNGYKHREGAPAVECDDGKKEWYLNGELHREDGPAVEGPNKRNEWWLNNCPYHTIDDWAIAAGIHDTDEFTMIKLEFG